jgi:thiamine biosynthesis protein ThiS
MAMKITINGEEKTFEKNKMFLSEILFEVGQEGDYLAVAINKNFIQKSYYKNQEVKEGDYLEVVSPHPGG